MAKHLESANTMFSFIWWIMGFYWLSAGGQALAKESPLLYWFVPIDSFDAFHICSIMGIGLYLFIVVLERRTSIIFLAFDVLFIVFCVALACAIGIAVCCCLPCIIAILYAVADQVASAHLSIFPCVFNIPFVALS